MGNFFDFNQDTQYTGELSSPINLGSLPSLVGTLWQPGTKFKMCPNSYCSDTVNIPGLDSSLSIKGVEDFDWDLLIESKSLKQTWFENWIKYLGIQNLLSETEKNTVINLLDSEGVLRQLSGPLLAWWDQDVETNEISIGVGLHEISVFKNWLITRFGQSFVNSLPPIWASPVMQITYLSQSSWVWQFEGYTHDYTGDGSIDNIETGGGSFYGEIKLAGDGLIPKYIVKKDVDILDPTGGRDPNNGITTRFCIGDLLCVFDTSTYTERYDDDGTWTWLGPFTEFGQEWYVADISNPCEDYRYVPIYDQLFPVRVISDCQFLDFEPTGLMDPTGFTLTKIGTNSVRIDWTKSNTGPRTLLLFTTDPQLSYPIDFEHYNVGGRIPNSNTFVLVNGGAKTYLHQNLTPGTTYRYGVWTVNNDQYSNGVVGSIII